MKTSLLLAGVTLLAASTFAQARPPAEPSHPVIEMRQPTQSNFRFHAHFGNACCSSDNSFAPESGESESPFASVEIVHAHGGPDFQPSSFMTFSQALSMGQQQAMLTPSRQSSAAVVQQMLDLIQEVRAVKDQNRADGKSGPVKWADLKSTLDPADYRRPPSTFMDYSRALALGEQEEAQEQNPKQEPSLGPAAEDQREAKPAEERAKVVIKQNADGSPVIVQKKPQQ
jgi:hypothetical protein